MRWATALYDTLLTLVAPSECAACDGTPINELGLCAECSGSLQVAAGSELRAGGVPVLAPFAYQGAIVDAIHRLKYGDRPDLARALAAMVTRCLGPSLAAVSDPNTRTAWFVPVPLHPRRLAQRGYNQSALLAHELARAERARWAPRLLRRTRDTAQQATLGGADRARNVSGAFSVHARGARRDRSVILVDDVVTTGATAAQCVDALREAGQRVVAVIAVARAGSGC
jgi:ComF family protein